MQTQYTRSEPIYVLGDSTVPVGLDLLLHGTSTMIPVGRDSLEPSLEEGKLKIYLLNGISKYVSQYAMMRQRHCIIFAVI